MFPSLCSTAQEFVNSSILVHLPLYFGCVLAWEVLDGKGFASFIAMSLAPNTLQVLTKCVVDEWVKQSGPGMVFYPSSHTLS